MAIWEKPDPLRELNSQKRTEHIAHIRLSEDLDNVKMDLFNGEVRDREKVFRGLKKQIRPF